MGQLKSHEGRFGLTLNGVYSKYAKEFSNRRLAVQPIYAGRENGHIISNRSFYYIPNHPCPLKKLGSHYQNVGKMQKNTKLHKIMTQHPDVDCIGIVDFGQPTDCDFNAKPPVATHKYFRNTHTHTHTHAKQMTNDRYKNCCLSEILSVVCSQPI